METKNKTIEQHVLEAGRSAALASGAASAARAPTQKWIDTKSGKPVPVVHHGESLAAALGDTKGPSIGRFLRGVVMGNNAPDAGELLEERKALGITPDTSGGYTVAGSVAGQWIDALRARSVLSQAGTVAIPMETTGLQIARVTGDPSISWHGENAALPTGDPTFGAITLQPKTCTCLVRLSLELAQDSANIEQQLGGVIVNAMAAAIDSAGLVGVTTDVGAAPGGIMNIIGRNSVTSIGAPTSWDFLVDGIYELLADNVPQELVGAFIAHPAVWKKMTKLKTGITNDNTPLPAPAAVAAIPKLWTTAAPLTGGTTAKGIIGNWRDYIMGVRQQIAVRVLTEAYMGSNLQVAILAYARVDFGAAHPASFCTLEGITV